MKDLPKVFANKIDKEFNNGQKYYYGNSKEISSNYNENDINTKIKNIFLSRNHIYKSRCLIDANGTEEEYTVIGKKGNYLVTMDGSYINIKDINDIKKIY